MKLIIAQKLQYYIQVFNRMEIIIESSVIQHKQTGAGVSFITQNKYQRQVIPKWLISTVIN